MRLKIFDSAPHEFRVILEPPQSPIAVETKDPPHLPRLMTMIHMSSGPTSAHRASSFLDPQKIFGHAAIDAVSKR